MQYLGIILFAYLIGCSSMSYYISKINKVDIKNKGSKNYGASNTVALIGWKAGILVAVHDIGKAVIAILLANYFYPTLAYAGIIAGVSCILGHIFPFYLHFDGGKGFASYMGMLLAVDWRIFIVLGIAVIIITLVTDYIVLATMTVMILTPICFTFMFGWPAGAIVGFASLVIIYKHRANLVRIYKGTETGLRSAHKGELREK